MSSYENFASLYDCLTENVDYRVRSDYISDFFKTEGISNCTILDLACGTGTMSVEFLKKGYSILGIDYSEDMLEIASERLLNIGNNFSLIKAKMQEFELPKLVKGCMCNLDSINHINSLEEVKKTFDNVYNSLENNGLFVFDVNTIYKHQSVLSNNTFVFDEDDFYLVWDNENIDNRNIRILLDMFIWNGNSYDRSSEEFIETAYSLDEIQDALIEVGFSNIRMYDELSLDSPKVNSERIYFVCKKVI